MIGKQTGAIKCFGKCYPCRDTVFLCCRDIGACPGEDFGVMDSPEAAGYFLFNFYHTNVLFGLVVAKWYFGIPDKGQYSIIKWYGIGFLPLLHTMSDSIPNFQFPISFTHLSSYKRLFISILNLNPSGEYDYLYHIVMSHERDED